MKRLNSHKKILTEVSGAKGSTESEVIEVFDPKGSIEAKFDFYIKIVLGVLVVTMLTMIMMTATLIIDSFHFNSVTYLEYSKKIETQNVLLEANKELMKENEENQELIQRNQQTIEELIRDINQAK